jgi:putative salt-induced outer membrane protein YdiY
LGLGALAAIVFSDAHAAELHLRNGDRLTGAITERSQGRIHLLSPLFGQVEIAESDVLSVTDPDEAVEALVGLPPSRPETPVTAPAAAIASTGGPSFSPGTAKPGAVAAGGVAPGAAGTGSVATAKTSSGKLASRPAGWRGPIEFGFQQEAGRRDGISASLRADAERERGPNQLKVNVRALYGELDNELISERSDASLRWRRQLSSRVFAQSVTSFLSDNVKGIDQNYEQNAGFGYALIKRHRHVVNVGGGVAGQFRNALRLNEGFAILGEVFEDYTFRMNSRLSFVQDFLAQYSPVSRGDTLLRQGELVSAGGELRNYRIRLNSALKGKVTDSISMNLRFEYDLDNTVLEQSAKADQRLISSIGYAF